MHALTNGRYQVKITPAGGGQSLWDWMALSRWVDDPVEDARGFFLYLRDLDDGQVWSVARLPVTGSPDRYEVSEAEGRFAIERHEHGIESRLEVAVSRTDDVEVRRLTLHNPTDQPRRLEVTSFIEIALGHPGGDLGHPAFSKLFVQTELLPASQVLVAKRRPRSQGESWPAMFHALLDAPASQWETDRRRFIGRGRNLEQPAALLPGATLSGTVGNVLDPIFSLRTVVELAPGASTQLHFVLGATADHNAVATVMNRYRSQDVVEKMFPPVTLTPVEPPVCPQQRPSLVPTEATPPSAETLRFFNGIGGFSEDGTEYVMRLPWQGTAPKLPPMPWINVLANEQFGCLISETGAGCTWSRNSQAYRLTPWSNDPVIDPHDEALYIRDEDQGAFWSPLPGPAPAPVPHETRHGFGYSCFASESHQLKQEVTVFVTRHDPLKVVRLRLTNTSEQARHLSLFNYQRLVLGSLPQVPSPIRTWQEDGVLCAENPGAGDFAGGIAFAAVVIPNKTAQSVTGNRLAFLGERGSMAAPQALRQPDLDGACGTGFDPCFARQVRITLPPGGTSQCFFLLGEAMDAAHLRDLLARHDHAEALNAALAEVTAFWKDSLGGVQVRTPVPEIDLMVNGWLAYQALACRIWGRTAFYQSSGAFGFRDQLQDAGNLSLLWPDLARQQILLHARHQFTEGDVLHWWHAEPVGRGVRTRFSDDLLWLPFIVSRYVRSTGDASVLDEAATFLQAPELAPGQEENYLKPEVSQESASVYEHCLRSLERSLTCGAHGLPLMGTGDWNDGMNRIGREGRGESVWLGFFLYQILGGFLPFIQSHGDPERAARYTAYRDKLLASLNTTGWDGAWYRRAYYDDGTPLGTALAEECRIDGLAQAWSVLSGAATPDHAAQAMDAAEAQLINEDEGLVRLLTPPFVNTPEDPGYIKGYVAGVRENGGQYTHAACWTVAALAKLGRRDRAARVLAMLSPLRHTRDEAHLARYQVEPYVIAADVYGAVPHIGRGGWTWYTGSAGWAWHVAVESVLGLRLVGGNTLELQPCIPDDWPEYTLEYRHPVTRVSYRIQVLNPEGCSEAVVKATLDGAPCAVSDGTAHVPLAEGAGAHEVVVTLGKHHP